MKFTRGLKDGLPIALGYLSVSFAYAIAAVNNGAPVWFPILISFTNFTGTGQFVGTNLIAAGASLIELTVTMLTINMRYALMSVSLSQKMGDGFPLWQRALLSFGVTDENYAVAIRQPNKLTFSYLTGLMSCSFCGWVGGTALGAALGDVFPDMLMSALGIALFAMFVAIIIPPARERSSVLLLVLISTAASCLFYFTPVLNKLSDGWVIIICSIICTTIVALLFPKDRENDDKPENGRTSEAGGNDGGPAPDSAEDSSSDDAAGTEGGAK